MGLEAGPLGHQQEGGVSCRGWMGEEKHCCCLGGSCTGGHSLAQEHWFASGPVIKIGWRLLSQGEDGRGGGAGADIRWMSTRGQLFSRALNGPSCFISTQPVVGQFICFHFAEVKTKADGECAELRSSEGRAQAVHTPMAVLSCHWLLLGHRTGSPPHGSLSYDPTFKHANL